MKNKAPLLFLLLSLFLSCVSSDKKEEAENAILDNEEVIKANDVEPKAIDRRFKYYVANEEKLDLSYKAQLIEYAIYDDTVFTEDALKNVVMEIYDMNKLKDVFTYYDKPTVLAVYLFTSKDKMKDKAEWIAMLAKGPNDVEPNISLNSHKIFALNNLQKNIKTNDEIEYEKLMIYLKKRGLELCSFYDLIKQGELNNIHKADAKHPDFGVAHMEMVDKLDEKFYIGLRKKYNLTQDKIMNIWSFASLYCK